MQLMIISKRLALPVKEEMKISAKSAGYCNILLVPKFNRYPNLKNNHVISHLSISLSSIILLYKIDKHLSSNSKSSLKEDISCGISE